jgi:hypothetical protein
LSAQGNSVSRPLQTIRKRQELRSKGNSYAAGRKAKTTVSLLLKKEK